MSLTIEMRKKPPPPPPPPPPETVPLKSSPDPRPLSFFFLTKRRILLILCSPYLSEGYPRYRSYISVFSGRIPDTFPIDRYQTENRRVSSIHDTFPINRRTGKEGTYNQRREHNQRRFGLSCVRLVCFLRKSTEFHVMRTDVSKRILFHFLLLIFS